MSAKDQSRFVTAEMRANVLTNAEKFDWIKRMQEDAIQSAAASIAVSDEELWKMVPSQEVPRAVYTTKGVLYDGIKPHCPECGEEAPTKFQTRSWWDPAKDKPWKLECRNCKKIYPKNDFEAFYQSGLDERGKFRRELGDKSLLFNAEHPEPNDPLHKLYVEDGLGMTDEKGQVHHMVGYYAHHFLWPSIDRRLNALVNAYAMTNKPVYAHKAAVLLDRIADVYPEMDYMPYFKIGMQHSHGGTGRGRIEGCIWECNTGENYSRWYDTIFDGIQGDDELAAFCSKMAKRYKAGDKSSIEKICRHIEKNLLQEFLISVKDGRIAGNTGMTHSCLATAAIAMDDPELTPQWLDWLFDPDFPGDYTKRKDPINWVLVEGLDRDGMGGENGNYGLIWTREMHLLAEILSAYPKYTKHNMVRDYPKLKQSFFVESRLNVLDAMMPNSGDSGSVGAWSRQGSASTCMLAYKLYGDPRFANLAWREHKTHGSSLRLDDDRYLKNPDALIDEVKKIARAEPLKLTSQHFGRYGQAYLQTEIPENGRAVFIHYGQGKGHSHHDCLHIGLLARNVAMIPDLGYPEYTGAWPKRHAWTANTISHNTLQINDAKASYSPGGKIELFVPAPPLRVMQVNAPNNYRGVKDYRRTVALIDVGENDSYVLDIFRARGGRNHRLSWHGAAETAQSEGLTLTKQEKGTFAGPDIPFTKLDGPKINFLSSSGFSYLYDIERSIGKVEKPYTVDWKIEPRHRIQPGEDTHLRLHALTPCDEVALATGDSPKKFLSPRYVIQSRLGQDMQSQFVNVLEPYEKTPFIKRVRQLKVEHEADEHAVAAVAVELADGRTDILISCVQPTEVKVEGGLEFSGMFGMIRLSKDEVQLMRLFGGTRIAKGNTKLESEQAVWRGKVVRIDASDPENNLVFLDPPLPPNAALKGRTIHFINDLPMDTSYVIRDIRPQGISTGDTTIVRGFKNQSEFSAGYTYLVNPGDEYVLPGVFGMSKGHR